MKKLLLILLCLPMIGFGQVQNNKSTFNFNKTNDYSQKESKTTADTIVYFNPLGADAGLIVKISNSEVRHIVTSYCLVGVYKGAVAKVCQENGWMLNKKMIKIILNSQGSELVFNYIKVASLDLDGFVNNTFSVKPFSLMNNYGIKQ
tara:strand:+ start:326 stop:766 length:441 start_codon:yes stop_codon:yes gene_type:complete